MFRLPNDTVLIWFLRLNAILAAIIIVIILFFLLIESIPALRTVGIWRFFTDPSWHPAGGAENGRFNLTPMLVGTLLVSLGAILLATPLGLASALFCGFYAPPILGKWYRHLVELLAGIPSVVYGFWGLITLAPIIRFWQPPGQGLLTGILILSIMILPTIALLSESSLRSVPKSYFLGAKALGLSRWTTIYRIALPAARGGILTAILLATARAIGETMAVLMVTGNVVQTPHHLFAPMRALTANIALELGYALDHHRSALFVSGLLLMALVIILVSLAEWSNREQVNG